VCTPPPELPGLARADLLLGAFVVLLAFLLASTAARNSDLWLHLATGRALVEGGYRFQGDPFGHDAGSWVAHSWLFDLIAYGLFQSLGGAALVVVKAGLVALLAGLMVRLGTRERGLGWPAVCTALALLALSGRLLLQPALISALLLAVTLFLLDRARRLRAETQAGWLAAYAPLCLLFALWANLDDWFLLGPVTVALCLLGEVVAVVAGGSERTKADLAGLAMLLGAGLLACVLTPFHIHGFTLPAELGLSATARALQQDPVLKTLFISPFNERYYTVGAAWSVPGVAYLALAVLSGLSFALNRDAWRNWRLPGWLVRRGIVIWPPDPGARRSWRLPVWLGFFALSAWSVRAVPFFAVIAGPILALNVQDFARRTRTSWSTHDQFLLARLGRAGAILLLLGLLVAAWPGWLQTPPYEMRRWIVLPDPSVVEAAQRLNDWRAEGSLGAEDRGFNFSPEEANYFAWFCPAEKGVVDSRLRVSPEEAADYVTVRRALLTGLDAKADWRSILRAHRINHVIVYDSNHERIQTVYQRLAANATEWFPLSLTGRTALFGWRDPKHEVASLERLHLSLWKEAYQPAEQRKAPREWPGRGPEEPAWWKAFVTTRSAGPDREEAALLLQHFETLRAPAHQERGMAWEASRLAGAIAAGGRTVPVRVHQALDLFCFQTAQSEASIKIDPKSPQLEYVALALRQKFFQQFDDAPPEYLWLAIRAARRALRDNPDDAYAYLILGEAYLRLERNTRERVWKARTPVLGRMRAVQAVTALNQALLRQPDLIPAHNSLVLVYQEMGLWDLRLQHLRNVLRLTLAKGRPANERVKEWDARIARLKEDVKNLEEDQARNLDKLDVRSANLKIIDRAQAAVQMGLGGKALDLLLDADAASFGARGVQLELHLLLSTGRVREVREWMSPDHRETLGDETYFLDRLGLASACGDYDQADAELAELIATYDKPVALFGIETPMRQAIALGIGGRVLEKRLQTLSPLHAAQMAQHSLIFSNLVQELVNRLRQIANFTVLRGLLALERGDTDLARQFMERALELYRSAESAASGAGLDFTARPMAEHYSKLLSSPPT
jgi:tetratricopeptide (TPR) repeat protein